MNRSRVTGDLASQGNIFVDIANDRVGIGSTIPTQKLDVTGTVKATSFSGDGSNLDGINTDLVSDTSPQLGGNLDVNTKNIVFGDSGSSSDDRLTFGAGTDLSIYHDGSHSYIHDGGTGNLKLRSNNFRVSNADESKVSATFVPSGAVELYNNHSKKLETTSYGTLVTGRLTTTGNITAPDSAQLQLGDGIDLALYHDGTNSIIDNNTGDLILRADADDVKILAEDDIVLRDNDDSTNFIHCINGGAVELYHNGNKKFDTTSSGVDVTGTVTADNQIVLNSGDSTPARIDLYCEVSNAHYTRLQAPAHSTYSGNVTATLPNVTGNLAVLANAANNRVVTATGTHGMTGETALTFYQAGNDSILTIEGTNSAGHAQLTLKTGGTTDHCSINFGDSGDHDAGEIRYTNSSDSLNFDTAGVQRMTLDSSGRLLVGTAAIQYAGSPLYVSGTDPVIGSFHHSDGGTNDQARIALGALANNPPYQRGVYLTAENNGAGHDFWIGTSNSHAAGPSEKFRIDSSGRILIGLSSDSRTTTMILSGNSSTGATGQAILNMDIGTTSISDGTSIGVIRFGATGDRRGADIKAEGAGTWSAGSSHPIDLIFATNPSSLASTPPERMRITSTGAVAISGNRNQTAPTTYDDLTGANQAGLLIGSSGITDAGIMLRTGSTGRGRIYFGDNSGSDAARKQGQIVYYNDGDYMSFATSGSEKLRITSNGMVEMRSDMSASGQENRNIFRFTDTDTSTTTNQSMGRLQWFSSDSSGGGACVKAEIEAVADDTTPEARILFKTHTGSGTTPTERMSIRNNGDVAVNTSGARIYTNSSNGNFKIMGGATYPGGMIRLYGGGNGGSGIIAFHSGQSTSEEERMRLDAIGRLLVGRTSATKNAQVQIGGRYVDSSSLAVDTDTTSGSVGPCLELFETGNTANQIAIMTFNHGSLKSAIGGGRVNTSNWGTDIRFFTHPETTNQQHIITERMKINSSGNLVPALNDTYDLGASALRWQNVYTTDLQLSNEGKANDVDGTWGDFTIQEGESNLFLINNRSGKKYKFNLTEVS